MRAKTMSRGFQRFSIRHALRGGESRVLERRPD